MIRCEKYSLTIDTTLDEDRFICLLSLLAVAHLPVSHSTWGVLLYTLQLGLFRAVLQLCRGQCELKLEGCIFSPLRGNYCSVDRTVCLLHCEDT